MSRARAADRIPSGASEGMGVRDYLRRHGRLLDVRTLATALGAAAIAITALLWAPAAAAHAPLSTADQAEPTEASTAIVITNVSGLDLVVGSFDATFYVAITCNNPCDPSEWDIINARSSTRTLVSESGLTSWWLVTGVFSFSPDLSLFPFDTQELPIEIEHGMLDGRQLTFVPNAADSGIDPEVSIAGWTFEEFTLEGSTTHYGQQILDYSKLTFTQPVTRSTIASIMTYYIPLIIFVLLGASTLVLSRNDYQIRVGGTALVGLTVFYLATNEGVGFSGAFTVWDASVLLGYGALGLVLTCGVVGAHIFNEGGFEGPAGAVRAKRLRFGFLWGLIGLVAAGAAAIAAVAILT